MKKILMFIIAAAGVFVLVRAFPIDWSTQESSRTSKNDVSKNEENKETPAVGGPTEGEEVAVNTNRPEAREEEKPLPSSILLDAPFTSQAPNGKWDPPYKEACEEAAMMILHLARNGVTSITADDADKGIKELVAYQVKVNGFYEDTTAEQTKDFAEKFYDESYEVLYDVTLEDIKKQLAAGRLVAAPMAGQLLGNPYYTPPGPPYHFLVLRGYDDATQEFITNDIGTRRGEKYRYSYDTVMNALHDWAGTKENITTGRKVIIVPK